MIRGMASVRLEAVVPIRVRGPGGTERDVDAVVDSGFTASLTLPATVVATLGLARQSGGGAVLADGSVRQFDIYAAEVDWGGSWRPVLASGVGDEVLLGMRLLAGHELRMAVVPGGVVEITPLPSRLMPPTRGLPATLLRQTEIGANRHGAERHDAPDVLGDRRGGDDPLRLAVR